MGASRVTKPVFVDTNLGTRVVVSIAVNCTGGNFKRKFQSAHSCCFPDLGKLNVHSLQVKRKCEFTGKECFYHLSESIPIEYVFEGEDRRLRIEASQSEQEGTVPLGIKRLKKKKKKKNCPFPFLKFPKAGLFVWRKKKEFPKGVIRRIKDDPGHQGIVEEGFTRTLLETISVSSISTCNEGGDDEYSRLACKEDELALEECSSGEEDDEFSQLACKECDAGKKEDELALEECSSGDKEEKGIGNSQLAHRECCSGDEEEDDEYCQLACEECGSGDNEEDILICDSCNKGFHMKCLRPVIVRIPTGNWCCPNCSPRLPQMSQQTNLTEMEIMHFFGLNNCMEPMEKLASALETRKRRRRSGSLVFSKKRRRLLPYVPTEDVSQRLQQMASLACALKTLDITFSPKLTYIPGMAPRSANEAKFENGGMQVLTKKDQETLNHIHAMRKRGLFPPLMSSSMLHDFSMNCFSYTVVADGLIKDLTLIAEYSGDVDYLKKQEDDDCGSLTTLLSSPNPAQSLVICPDKRGNIARFISGINNHLLDSKKKLNLKCVRYAVNGECRVLLVATRDIAKGERLYYDYNAHEYEYPTHNFV